MIESFLEVASKFIPIYSTKTIFEVGSRDLVQSIEFAYNFPQATIHAFEANPFQHGICMERATRFRNIRFNPYGLLDKVCKTKFYRISEKSPDPNIGASSIFPWSHKMFDFWAKNPQYKIPTQEEIEIDCSTLKAYCQQNQIEKIDLLWLDTQGSELSILKGAEELIKNISAIHMEVEYFAMYENQPIYEEVIDFCRNAGFKEVWSSNAYAPHYKEAFDIEHTATDIILINNSCLT